MPVLVVVALLFVVGLWWLRRRGKRRLVAGLDASRPGVWREPAPGRVSRRSGDVL
ncbi:MAG TPA: hypothetical protein VFQ37_16680 [Mycobacterium sp.]|nr:hypothetical protein [Mycobacterium sp.]